MGSKKIICQSLLGTLLFAATTACATVGGHPVASSDRVVIGDSRTNVYTSVRELIGDSAAIVVAHAESQQSEDVHSVPFTTTTMTIVSTIRGEVPSSFRVRQVGSPGSEEAPVASPGSTYLLFLQSFQLQPGIAVADDLFVTVGASSGMYLKQGTAFRKTDPDAIRLPSTVTEADVASIAVG